MHVPRKAVLLPTFSITVVQALKECARGFIFITNVGSQLAILLIADLSECYIYAS